ncbi:MAG TPA: NADH-quinone oxidoreductase subunit M [Polyangiaceae bacterium]|jgi:NADH-quinone oxidoreductase subunit M
MRARSIARIPVVVRAALSALFALALAVLLALGAAPARAATGARATGRISLSLPGGAPGPLVLTPGQGGWVGHLTVANLGAEPLIVSRVAIRGDEDDVRSPARVGVRFADGAASSATLPPGASKDVIVSWMPDRDPRVRQAFGHVVVTSTDEESGEVAMGFRAEVPTGIGWVGEHALSLVVLLPFLVVLAAGIARLVRRRDEPAVRHVAIGVSAVQLALALWAWARFVPEIGRADGNDGFQLVERFVWIRSVGAEWYLGVDGVSIALVVLAAALGLVSLVAVRPPSLRADAYHATHALLVAGILGALVALDLVVLFAALAIVFVAAVMLVGGWGGPRAEHAASKLGVYGAIGSAAMLAAFVALSRASEPTFLVDGMRALHTLSVPELARTSFASKGPILGVPFVEAVWVLLFVAVAVLTPIVPLHGWFPEALEEAPPGAAILLGGAVVALGPYVLVRVGLAGAPEGARWAGASMAALGVLSVAYGGLCAMAQRDLRRFVGYATIAGSGAAIFGLGAFSPQAIAGAVAGLFAHGLAAALLLGVAGALEDRVRTTALARVGGLGEEAPRLALLAGVGLAVSLGVPLFVGFWGQLLVLLGAFARHPVLAAVAALAVVLVAAAHLRVGRILLLGRFDPARRKTSMLEPFGGRLPDATGAELGALLPLVLLALLLGVWPTPLLSSLAVGVRDVSVAIDPSLSDAMP